MRASKAHLVGKDPTNVREGLCRESVQRDVLLVRPILHSAIAVPSLTFLGH